MKSITMTIAMGIALLGWAPNGAAAPEWNGSGVAFARADSLEIPGVLAVFEPGVLVRTKFAECGDEWPPIKEITGRFVEFEQDAFQIQVRDGIHTQLHRSPSTTSSVWSSASSAGSRRAGPSSVG